MTTVTIIRMHHEADGNIAGVVVTTGGGGHGATFQVYSHGDSEEVRGWTSLIAEIPCESEEDAIRHFRSWVGDMTADEPDRDMEAAEHRAKQAAENS
jgi:hypothetical protein